MLSSLSTGRDGAGRALPRARTGRPPRKTAIVIAVAVTLELAGLAFWALLVAGAR